MSKWTSDQDYLARNGTPQSNFVVPGSFPSSTKENQRISFHRHNLSNSSSQSGSRGGNYHAYRDLTQNNSVSSPKSIHTRSDSQTIQNNISPLIRTTSRKKSQTNYLKLIPPMPDPSYTSPTPPQPVLNRPSQQVSKDLSSAKVQNLYNIKNDQVPARNQTHTHNNSQNNNHIHTPPQNNLNQTQKYLHAPPQFNLPPQQRQQQQQQQQNQRRIPPKFNSSTPNSANVVSNGSSPNTVATRGVSLCAACHKPITTKSVKALGKRYHTQCFGCADCGTPILSKYFPFEKPDGEKIPLCEEHFYKRRGLTCCVCDNYLKGTHFTVFGRKYDAEHFCCKICSKKFDTDEDFFNHDNNIYCHYHFSKFFIDRCEGCEFAILKQYVEIFRGGRNQKWHVECYMIHKCWNVSISPDSIGIASLPVIEPTEENLRNLPDINPTPEELVEMETKASEKISEIWNTLFKFEEDTATCISDMLQFATIHDQRKGLIATVRLILKIDALFRSIDSLHRLGINSEINQKNLDKILSQEDTLKAASFTTLKKEPRNLSAKIMIYLAILRKASRGVADPGNAQDLILSVVTGLAHYLKLLIRYGLYNSLQYNKSFHTTNALDRFIREIKTHENVPEDPLDTLDIPLDASDLCFHCRKSIESACVQYQDKRWHIECLNCTKCNRNLQAAGGVADACFNSRSNWVLCAQCATEDPDARTGFRSVSKLLQLGYLLKIAIIRSKAVMDYALAHRKIDTSTDYNLVDKQASELNYMKTLNDIKRLRSTRQNTRITNNERENVRKSVVIQTSESGSKDDLPKPGMNQQFMTSEENVTKQKITVEDEPVGPSLSKKSFNRATNFINNQKVLTLDDIPRIVAAEHARELRPNTYKFHNPHQEGDLHRDIKPKHNSLNRGTSNANRSVQSDKLPDADLKYYSQLSDQERFVITHISGVLIRIILEKQGISKDIDVTKFIELKKTPTFWEKLRLIGNSDKKNTLTKVFGTDLRDLTAKTGVDSSQSNGPSKVRVPMLIDDLLTALYQKDMSVEGVFRKNGNIKRLKEITSEIDSNPSRVPDLTNENAVQLSALLKKFLRELPNPLLTFKLYDLWILTQKVKDENLKQTLVKLSYSLLPKDHRDVAEVLLFFFMWTSSFSHLDEESGSKMDIHNLATVLSPNILFAQPAEVARQPNGSKGVATTYYDAFKEGEGENYYLAIEVVNYLIAHNEELTIVPSYLLEIYTSCGFENDEQLTSRDIFARVESVVKKDPSIIERVNTEWSTVSSSTNGQVVTESNHQEPLATSIENP
ncbi:Rho-type GTPase-activating protein 1 [Wickerhamomyces ciferrii]|uniref:Rho-type GTPase-activating protein 1 n=1 Tax=Wickerhamomyces ciferrii (strain ATCC 14091 / BCRC 22168 / CBS 111 / JCM 3599 / NBRC 0793 / NRRL Y-1031 F-60-10) TaxID=1206466 RepID=K0KHZ8_WICCF|nr:Rho-type GTPase-activating protein 1 [Wickerhamomyces ciferrii]CCH41777.1 Rho-type GTPase-activating protein 1 [Wickerhamomyces ciferrii]